MTRAGFDPDDFVRTLPARVLIRDGERQRPKGRARSRWLALLLTSALSCTFAVTEQRAVEIEGPQPAAEKIALAERVVASFAAGDLAGRVHVLVPDAPAELIRALAVEWRRFVGVETTPDGPRQVDTVLLRCQLTLPRADARAGPILDACKRLLEDAIDAMAESGVDGA
jgi:hypothetical protein